MSLSWYIEHGFPACDRQWTGTEMLAAGKAVDELARTAPASLPRFGSKRSGAMFARITNIENMAMPQNKSLPVQSRLGNFDGYLQGLNTIFKAYFAHAGREIGNDELVELFSHMLDTMAVMSSLMDEFVATLDKSASNYQVRMDGLRKAKEGTAITVSGVLMCLEDTQQLSLEHRRRLAAACERTFPRLFPFLPELSRTEFTARLTKMASDPKLSDMKTELLAVCGAVAGTK